MIDNEQLVKQKESLVRSINSLIAEFHKLNPSVRLSFFVDEIQRSTCGGSFIVETGIRANIIIRDEKEEKENH